MGADAAAAGDFKAAGAHYGRIVGGKPPFEELALLLVEAGDPEALQIFLNTKLQVCVDVAINNAPSSDTILSASSAEDGLGT
jgi:hypothetical protein